MPPGEAFHSQGTPQAWNAQPGQMHGGPSAHAQCAHATSPRGSRCPERERVPRRREFDCLCTRELGTSPLCQHSGLLIWERKRHGTLFSILRCRGQVVAGDPLPASPNLVPTYIRIGLGEEEGVENNNSNNSYPVLSTC